MKTIILILFIAISININAQPNPYDIREAITKGVEKLNVEPEDVHKIINKEISGGDFSIPLRIYYPSNKDSLPILYHIHGGAWIAGNLDTHDNICRHLANETNSIVVAIDYRRPPEYKYPIALEDCHFILKWLNKNFRDLKGNGKIYLIGDSAGGGLVASLSNKNIESDSTINIAGQVLINPATDLRDGSASHATYKLFIDWYIPPGIDRSNPFISPITSTKFMEIPKSIIVVSEKDEIKGDGIVFHDYMIQNGRPSVLFELKETGHLGGNWAGNSDIAKPAIEFVVEQLNKWFDE
jgi:acetyl esterase/lipase